jgi:hypothetical protein
MISVSASEVRAATNPTQFIVGTTTTTPKIDGQWQSGEWDSANEYKLTISFPKPVAYPPYIRMTHDSANLYGLIDVPSDDGSNYIDANGVASWGAVLLEFYYGSVLDPNNQTQLYSFFELNTDQTNIVTVGVNCRCPGMDANVISSHSLGATTISSTPHFSTKHRVWEFAVPMYPYVVKKSLDTNPSIGFYPIVRDSSEIQSFFVLQNKHSSLMFVGTPVPETTGGEIMLSGALFGSLILVVGHRKKRAQ